MNTTPYIIGITGHRDLDESATNKVHQHLLGFLTNIKKQLQNTPIIILSGMADGADRIIVKVALELELNIKALMPMPGKEYCKDFSEASYKEFRQLCKSENVVVEVVEQIHQLDKGEEITGQDRDNQYWVLGQYLINHVNLLVAVWDGQNTGYTGGTSDVLLDYLEAKPRRKQDRIDNKAHQITLVEDNQQQPLVSRFVYWLKVDKTEQGHSVDGSLQSCFLSGKESKYTFQKFEQPPTCLLADIQHIDEYNEKVCELLEENKISDDYSLLNDYDLKKSPIPKEMLKKLDEEFLKADAVAVHNQKYSDSQFATFSLMAAMMGILFLVYAKIVASKILLIGYLLLFFFGWRYYKHAEKANRFTKHLTARALAETLRTQFYLTLDWSRK